MELKQSTHQDAASPENRATSPFVRLFRDRAIDTSPAKPLLSGRRTLSYGEVLDTAARLSTLVRDRSLTYGDRGVIVTDDDRATVAIFLGLLGSGITSVVLDPHATGLELERLLSASDASVLFLDDAVIARLPDHCRAIYGPQIIRVPKGLLPKEIVEAQRADALPDDIPLTTSAYILFTSGTTSAPKGVEISHGALFASYVTMAHRYQYDRDSRILNLMPMSHADGLSEGAVMAFYSGATIHRPGLFTVHLIPALLNCVRHERITHFHVVPTMLALIDRTVEGDSDSFVSSDFRHVISSAGSLSESLWRRFETRFKTKIMNVYGLTEAGRELLYCGPDDATRKIGTNGKPIDCHVRIVGEDGEMMGVGVVGELAVRIENYFMKGYFRRPAETASVMRDGWYYTGDLAVEDAEGFYTIVGRKKNIIITGGVNVYPEDVSRTIIQIPGVTDAVTVGVPDATFGERVVSCVTTQGVAVTPNDIIAYCRKHLSREKVPSQVYVLDELPRGPAGKIALPQVKDIVAGLEAARERATQAAASEQPANQSREAITQQVLEIAAQCFQVDVSTLGLDAEPETTEGWNSLAHMDFILGLESAYGIKIPPAQMLEIVTLGDAVDCLCNISAQGARRDAQ